MKKMSLFGFLAVSVGAAAVMSAACSTEETQATDVWKNPSYVAGPMKNIIVVGARMTETNRRTLEDGFVSALAGHGTRATPSYTVLPTPMPSKDAARALIQQKGFDGVLVATFHGVNENATVVEGGPGFWDGFYGAGWGQPYVVTDPVVKYETSLWDPSGAGKMVWSATTDSEGPSTGKDFTASLTKKVVPMMTKAGVILPVPGQNVSYAPHTSIE